MEAFLAGQPGGMLVGLLKVVTVFDQLRAQRTHGRVLLAAVPMWNYEDGPQAGAARCKSDTLAVVSTSGRDHSGHVRLALPQFFHVDQAAPDFERADRSVILVIHPDLSVGARAQQRPTDLRRRRDHAMDQLGCGFQCVERRQGQIAISQNRGRGGKTACAL